MKTITFDAVWNGEAAAGIRAGSEAVTISFVYGEMDADAVEYFRECVAEYFDGAGVKARTAADDDSVSRALDAAHEQYLHDKALPDGQEEVQS